MFNGSDVVTALFGIEGMRVRAHAEIVDEWWLKIETAADVAGCSACGTRAVGHGRRKVRVRDLPVFGRPVVLLWAKRIWRCPDPDCETKTWTEHHPAMKRRQVLTERARFEICRLVGADGWSVARAARAFGVGWHCAWAAVVDHGLPLINDPARTAGVTSLGVDETRFLARTRNRATVYVTGMVDLDRKVLLDVAIGRSGKVVTDWLEAQPLVWRAFVRVAAIDAFRGYATGIAGCLNAELVLDRFHVVRLANQAVDDVRRRTQQETLGHRGRKGDPLYGIRRLLLVAGENLDQRGWDRLQRGLDAGDRWGEVGAALLAKELLREVFTAVDIDHAHRRLIVFFQWCADAGVPELVRLASTIDRWTDELLAFHTTGGASNGGAEAVNLLIENARRVGYGFRNFDNYRLRLLLACGIKWQTPPVARIRGRQPRSAA